MKKILFVCCCMFGIISLAFSDDNQGAGKTTACGLTCNAENDGLEIICNEGSQKARDFYCSRNNNYSWGTWDSEITPSKWCSDQSQKPHKVSQKSGMTEFKWNDVKESNEPFHLYINLNRVQKINNNAYKATWNKQDMCFDCPTGWYRYANGGCSKTEKEANKEYNKWLKERSKVAGVTCNESTKGKALFYEEGGNTDRYLTGAVCDNDGSYYWGQLLLNFCNDDRQKPEDFHDINLNLGVWSAFTKTNITAGTITDQVEKCEYDSNATCLKKDYVCDACPQGYIYNKETKKCTETGATYNKKQGNQPEEPAELKEAKTKLDSFFSYAKANRSGWKTADGKFNSTRLASDITAGVVLGTVGGVVSGVVIKKKQVEKGFEALHCTVGGQKVADWGDEFSVGFHK